MRILLVSPRTPRTFWSFCHVLPFVSRRAAFPPLGLLTVAAMLPREWELRLVDLNVSRLRDEQIDWADYVFVSGMIVHADSLRRVIERCQARKTPVVAGGPLVTGAPQNFANVDHLVLGEAEDVMPELVADLAAGRARRTYQCENRPDVTRSPIPRWDLLNMRQYATMSLQFSRGCPFDCEFCDIIVMYGRVPRVKTPAQVVAELESLSAAGWRGTVFVVDDNFIGNRARVKELLRALIAWRERTRSPITFLTEASLNLVDDPELVELMVRAGFKRVFIGIESPQEESLVECAKGQNRRRDMVEAVRTLHQAGIEVMGGFILGFDHDRHDIFDKQSDFIQQAGVVTAMVGLLTALPGTRLFTRLAREGRLQAATTGNNVDAHVNFVPALDQNVLVDGYRRLVKSLYSPKHYYERIRVFLRDYRPSGPRMRVRLQDVRAFLRSLWVLGVATRGRRQYWALLVRALLFHRRAFAEAMSLAIMGYHFRRVAMAL
ncbi:MAG: B12-binding domain-containing radical SAM protein [Phycisphaerae bacterium]